MKGNRVYWPVYYSQGEDGHDGIAYFSDQEMADGIVKMFLGVGLAVSKHPPVRLGIYDTFLFDQAK